MPSFNNWNQSLLLKIVNVLIFAFLFGSGIYGSMSPHGVGGRETAFTPSAWAFGAWYLIDIGLLLFVIYQFFDDALEAVNAIGFRFALVGIFQAIFLHTFRGAHYIVAFIFALLTASSVSTIYYTLAAHYPAQGVLSALAVHLPFSLFHAWSIVTIFISGFAAFTHAGHGHHVSLVVKVLVCLSLAFLATTAWAYAFRSRKGDIVGAFVIVWTLAGIYTHQHNHLIKYFALASAIVGAFAIVKSLYFTFVAGDGRIALGDDERAPLVQ